MKKVLLYSLAACAIIAVTAACNKEQTTPKDNPSDEQVTPGDDTPSSEMVTIHFTAEYPDLAGITATAGVSKTTVTDEGVVSWEKDDVVTLYYLESGTPASAPATASAAGKSVEFTATIPAGTTTLWAAYPAGTGTLTGEGAFSINLNNTHTGAFAAANYAVAYTDVTDIDNITLSFKNAGGIFRIPIPEGGVISHNAQSYTLGSITISDKVGTPAFLGTVAVSVNGSTGELEFAAATNPITSTAITLNAASRAQSYVYIPSLPVSSTDGLVFRFTDTGGKAIPAVVTKDGTAISLERGHIKPASAVGAIVWDWYYSASGTGNGRSSESPAGVTDFQDILNATSTTYGQWRLNGATLHLSGERFNLTETLHLQGSETGTVTIDGAGQASTILHGGNSLQIMAWESAMDLKISNLRFVGASSSNSGAALSTSGASGKLTLDTVTFYSNTSTGNAGGILLSVPATLTGCIFNTNSGNNGGAITVPSAWAGSGAIDISETSFTKNTASTYGGAIYHAGNALIRVDHCSFTNNTGVSVAGVIYTGGTGSKLFVNRSLFAHNKINYASSYNYNQHGVAIFGNANSVFACYNCTFNDNAPSQGKTAAVVGPKFIVANSTFVEGSANSMGVIQNQSTTAHNTTVVNNIICQTGTSALSRAGSLSDAVIDSGYNLFKGAHVDFQESTSYYGDNVVKATFGFDSYSTSNYSYVWGGDVSAFTGFNKGTPAQVEALIKANTVIGADFWSWLDDLSVGSYKATEVDIRGTQRTATNIWPGSYQNE